MIPSAQSPRTSNNYQRQRCPSLQLGMYGASYPIQSQQQQHHYPANQHLPSRQTSLRVPLSPGMMPMKHFLNDRSSSMAGLMLSRPSPPFSASPPPPSASVSLSTTCTSSDASPSLSGLSSCGNGPITNWSPCSSASDLNSHRPHPCNPSQHHLEWPTMFSSHTMPRHNESPHLVSPFGTAAKTPLSQPQISSTLRQRIMKTKLCVHHLHGRCARGVNCAFAHSVNELRRPPNLYKTRLCINFTNNGSCPKGELCRFAHGDNELRAGENIDELGRQFSSGAESASCIESPTLLSSSTPSTMMSPATPARDPTQNRILERGEQLLEADAIDVLLKLPEKTRQHLVDLVVRTVAATHPNDKARRGSVVRLPQQQQNQYNDTSGAVVQNNNSKHQSPTRCINSVRGAVTKGELHYSYSQQDDINSLNMTQKESKIMSAFSDGCGLHAPPRGVLHDGNSDSLEQVPLGIDPYSAAARMILYEKLPSLPPPALPVNGMHKGLWSDVDYIPRNRAMRAPGNCDGGEEAAQFSTEGSERSDKDCQFTNTFHRKAAAADGLPLCLFEPTSSNREELPLKHEDVSIEDILEALRNL